MPDVERRIASLFAATLNPEDRQMGLEEVLDKARSHDGLLLTSFDKLGPNFIPALPPRSASSPRIRSVMTTCRSRRQRPRGLPSPTHPAS